MEELAEQVSFSCSATPADCYLVIMSLVTEVSNSLERGKIVRLGNLGSFQVSIKGDSCDTPEAVKAQNVTSASILFRPGKKLKTMLKRLVFVPKKQIELFADTIFEVIIIYRGLQGLGNK